MKQLDIVIQQEQLSKVNCILIKIIKSVILYSMMLREEAEQKHVINIDKENKMLQKSILQ